MMIVKRSILIAFSLAALAGPPALAVEHGGQFQDAKVDELTFPGGPLVEFVAAVRRVFPNANIVLGDEAAQFIVPHLQLRNVQLHETMEILPHIAQSGDVEREESDIFDRTRPPGAGSSQLIVRPVGTIWTIQAYALRPMQQQPRTAPSVRPTPTPTTIVFAVIDILDNFKAEDVFTSIETALGFTEDAPAVQLRLHEETGLLIARGLPAQMATVEIVMEQLRAAAHMRVFHVAEEPDDREAVIETLRNEIRELQAEIARLRQQRGETRRPE